MALPPSLSHITTEAQWRSLILTAGGDYWHVYMSRRTAGGKNTVKYPGRYLKKSPIAGSRLAHYASSAMLSFRYHDHNTGQQATETTHPVEVLPDGALFWFLANRVCGEKLPPGMEKPAPVPKVCFKQFLRRDPFGCVLCGGKMVYRLAVAGLNVQWQKIHAREISLMRYISA